MRCSLILSSLLVGGLAIAPAVAQYGNICPDPGNNGGNPGGPGGPGNPGGPGGPNTPGGPGNEPGGPGTGSGVPGPGYRGPGDRPGSGPSTGVPGTGGGTPGPADAPGSLTPSAPTPSAPSGPTTGPTPGGGPTGLPGATSLRVGLDLSLPLDAWDRWWAANRERYLNLRGALVAIQAGPLTGEGNDMGAERGLTAELRTRVGEQLLGILEGSVPASSSETQAALLAAAKLGYEPARTRQAMQSQLRNGAQRTRELAALSLGLLGEAASAPLLVALAKDMSLAHALSGQSSIDARTRSFAMYGLGLLARKPGQSASIPRLARETLLQVASENVASIDISVAALSALGVLPTGESERWTRCYPALEELMQSKGTSDFVRAHIPTAVARLDGTPWSERFALITEDDREHPLVRASALLAIARCGDELQPLMRTRVLKSLTKARERTGGSSERSFATLALAQMGDADSLKSFEREVITGAHLDQPWLALGLGLAAREETIAGKDCSSRVNAMRRALRAAKAPETRGALAIALALTKSSDAIPDLRKAFASERIGRTRGHIAVALGLLGDSESAPKLRAALNQKGMEAEEISEIATALGLMKDFEAVPALIARLKNANSTAELGPLARALGRIGDARAAEALLDLAADSHSSQLVRTYAIAGLGVIFDAGPLPWSVPYTEDLNYLAATPSLFASGGLLDLL